MKKNGFTLIELLAIIVILAIIAVITVPIILNIIESSKKGAIKDSAYGYKDSVNKWYVSKLTEDPNYVLNDGTYSVSELGATVEGKQPGDNSWVTISKTNVTDGCLQFDEYTVEITNGEVGEASVGECEEPVPCPGPECVYMYSTDRLYFGIDTGHGLTILSDETLYKKNYSDIVNQIGKSFFLGLTLTNTKQIDRAFSCGIHSNGTVFCIEAKGSEFHKHKELLNGTSLWNGSCTDGGYNFNCGSNETLYASSNGGNNVVVGNSLGHCDVSENGQAYCYTY